MIRARDGSLWIGTFASGAAALHRRTTNGAPGATIPTATPALLGHPLVNSVFEDARGRIWVGTLNGLNLLDPASGTLRRFRHDPADSRQPAGDLVRAVHQSPDGTLWVGTHTGLNQVNESGDGSHASRIRWPTAMRLPPGPRGFSIAEDPRRAAVAEQQQRHRQLRPRTQRFRRYSLPTACRTSNSTAARRCGWPTAASPSAASAASTCSTRSACSDSAYAPPVRLLTARIGATRRTTAARWAADAGLSVARRRRCCACVFAALDFAAAAEPLFRYRLDAFDRDWIDTGTQPDATYTNLDPGDYVFRVRATNHDGVWSQKALALPVHVLPPWWNSAPAHRGYGAGAARADRPAGARAARAARARAQPASLQIREREERLNLALWGSGDEFWDWDIRANTLYRLGADQRSA